MQPGKRARQLDTLRFPIGLPMQQGKRAGQLAYQCIRESEQDNWPVVRLDFPGCICSPMEKRVPTRTIGRGFENASGLGFWTSHPLHHAHVVNRQSHVRPEPEEPERRTARAKRGDMSPRPPKCKNPTMVGS